MSFFSENLNIRLNEDQLKAVHHKTGPALVLAVPGSGKTTMLICRTLILIEAHQVDPKRILSLTFSKASALDMAERYKTLFSNRPYKIGFSTIHRFCYGVLLDYFKGMNLTYQLLEAKETNLSKGKLIKSIYFEITQKYMTEDVYEEMCTAISYAKNMMVDVENYQTSVPYFKAIFLTYEKKKKEMLYMDFDDMLTMCYKLFMAKPEILHHYQNQFDYIQTDESQDTSKVQHMIIQLLSQKHNNVFMVADDDQSIYGFRGAFPDVIVNIDQYYPGTKKYYLTTNYRSSKDIIDLCQKIIGKNTVRHIKTFSSAQEHNAVLEMVYVDTTEDQTRYIVDSHKKNDLNKAVLFRNTLSLIPLVDVLDREDVDFMIKDPNHNFFTNWCTLDIMSFLKVAMVPNDVAAFERIYYKMNAYLSKVHLQHIKDHYKGINLFDTLLTLPNLEPFQLKSMRKIKNNFEMLGKLSPELAIEFIEDELNYRAFLSDYCKKNKVSLETQNKYLDVLKFIARHTDSITDFMMRLNHLKKLIFQAAQNKNPYALKLLTMHASKGLEFEQVYVIDVDHDVFPSKFAIDMLKENEIALYEEERRLFYVALSRAKSQITLIHTKFKNGQYNKASEFVKDYSDFGHHHLKQINFSSSKASTPAISHYKPGDKLLHTSFGVGYLIEIDGDRMMIEFGTTTKILSSALCQDSKMIIKMD